MVGMWIEGLGSETRFYDVGGIRTRTIEAGYGPAIIFMHGSGGHAEAFIRNIVPLSSSNRVVAMDYLGSGLTGYTEGLPTLQQRIDHVIGLMDAMGLASACLAGESFGGTLAFAIAKAYPERVSSLIIIVGGAYNFGRDAASFDKWEDAMNAVVNRQREFLANPSRDTVRQRLAWLFHKPERDVSEELVDVRWSFYQREAVRQGLSDLCKMISEDVAARKGAIAYEDRSDALRPMNESDLHAVSHRTLFIWTDHNPSTPAAVARTAASYVPDAQFVVMEDCGHWPQWEHPEVFNPIVAEFLAATRAPERKTA